MRDQLMVLADYIDPTRDVGTKDYSNNTVLSSSKNFTVEWMEVRNLFRAQRRVGNTTSKLPRKFIT